MNDSFEKVDKETIGMLRNAHMKQTQLTCSQTKRLTCSQE